MHSPFGHLTLTQWWGPKREDCWQSVFCVSLPAPVIVIVGLVMKLRHVASVILSVYQMVAAWRACNDVTRHCENEIPSHPAISLLYNTRPGISDIVRRRTVKQLKIQFWTPNNRKGDDFSSFSHRAGRLYSSEEEKIGFFPIFPAQLRWPRPGEWSGRRKHFWSKQILYN